MLNRKFLLRFILIVLCIYALAGILYWSYARPLHLNWGASLAERNKVMPGDSFISSNRIVSTRAITIHAMPEEIWPWIAQTGQNKGGFNSYDWLENLFGARMNNASRIHPEWQQPEQGDTVWYGQNQGFELISLIRTNNYYCLGGWTFYLEQMDTKTTRLILRYPSPEVRQHWLMKCYYYGLFESLHFIMESGMMLGIRRNAEIYGINKQSP